MKSDFMMALNQLSAERGLRKDLVLDKVELALATAFRRDSVAGARNLSVKLNPNTGDISIFPLRTVVDEIDDPETQIILAEAQEIAPDVELGSEIPESDEVHYDTSRISAQTARQVLIQGLREAEREKVFEEYSAFQGEIINGSVDSVERNNRAVHINPQPPPSPEPAHPRRNAPRTPSHRGTLPQGAEHQSPPGGSPADRARPRSRRQPLPPRPAAPPD